MTRWISPIIRNLVGFHDNQLDENLQSNGISLDSIVTDRMKIANQTEYFLDFIVTD